MVLIVRKLLCDIFSLIVKRLGGQFAPPVVFPNMYLLQTRWNLLFVTFNIIISHIFSEKFHWISSSSLQGMKIFSVNINYFHQFFGFFDNIFSQRNWWRQHISTCCCCMIMSAFLVARVSTFNLPEIGCLTIDPPEKTTLKKPSIMRVKSIGKYFIEIC